MMDVKDKHITIIGAARSGIAVASLLKRKGAEVFVSDYSTISEPSKIELNRLDIEFEEGGHSSKAEEGDFAVVSPGVPSESRIVQHYLNSGKSVYSEVEMASMFTKIPIIATTGTNGKTTVTSWIGHTWKTADWSHAVAGNIGTAFSEVSDQLESGHFILEVSSFQLDHIHAFKPFCSLILNITPDHLDRYQNNFDKYAAAKFRITENQDENDFFIYNYDDPVMKAFVEGDLSKRDRLPRIWAFSNQNEVPEGAFVRNDHIIFKFNNKEEPLMPVFDLGLPGHHNLNNGLATALAARAAEITNEVIRESLQSFEGVEHRLELVRVLDGVKYINDSKATNVNAVWYALDSFNVPLTLILGGRDKGNDYSELHAQIRDKVHSIIAIGESKDKILKELDGVAPQLFAVDSMNEAVRMSRKLAKKGEIVLLSPACASFDMFDDYEHRGRIFKEEVNKL
jgi:UDP-N-acetylmuramoylalanine--D-glutamate ligase